MEKTNPGPSGYIDYSFGPFPEDRAAANSGKELELSRTENDYNKLNLARILVAGVKAEYGPEKAEEVQKEFEKLQRPSYRKNAEELTAVVERVCQPEIIDIGFIETESVDAIVRHEERKPSYVRVAVKTARNVVDKTKWYYSIFGMMPGKIQNSIAEKRNEYVGNYTLYHMGAEFVAASIIGYSSHGYDGLVFGLISALHSLVRFSIPTYDKKGKEAAGPIYTALPYHLIVYTLLASKAIPGLVSSVGTKVKGVLHDSYSSALQEVEREQQRLLPPPEKKRIEAPQYQIVMTPDGEKFEEVEESDQRHNLKNSGI